MPDRPFRQQLVAVGTQTAAGASFTATFPAPRAGYWWELLQLVLEVPNYTTGALRAVVTIAGSGRFIAASNQGQRDTAAGVAEIIHASEQVQVVWTPTRVAGPIFGRATMIVLQHTGA